MISRRIQFQCCIYIAMILHKNDVYAEETKTYRITDKVFTCSGWLSLLINKVCDNVYKIVKRDTSLLMEKLTPKSVQEQKTKQRKLAKERWRRVRRQVASECCDRPCTVGNIIMYCPEDAKLLRENPDLFDD
ncbi:bombyxin A-3 homolog [Achroia grisella]|uniref:bombyxin A-3 homolog n=1 Tax=Achroia grisella TaxID=688607 RepID=UPI0027D2B460|nr:bombyxin A-3 homolog [Achroia grisella]